MKQTIVFVHGMFQNDKSWTKWLAYFEERGFSCIAPAWPDHEGDPRYLREHVPPTLGDLRLENVLKKIEDTIVPLTDKPIVIGHSVGGLIVQLLANKNLISLGVCIDSVAPNAMLSMDWNFFKNSVTIANPFKGDQPIEQTPESFHEAFCNTLNEADAKSAFETSATHDSRNVLRDCMMKPGHVDLNLPHAPLLFIASEKDHIIPDQLVEKNANRYTDKNSIVNFKEFEDRSHYICGEPGWEEVADHIHSWIGEHLEFTNEDEIPVTNKNS